MIDFLPSPAVARTLLTGLVAGEPDDEAARRLFALHAWSCLVEPGDGVAGRVVAALGPEAALAALSSESLPHTVLETTDLTAAQWQQARDRWRPRLVAREVRNALEIARHSELAMLVPGDRHWPAALTDLGQHAPFLLWVRGDPGALVHLTPSVALVGARAASGYGEHVAAELSADLAGRGVTVVSGAAYGIDGAAHRAALAAGGRTVALLAGGADQPYPRGHSELIRQIAQSGAVLSEVPCGSPPTKWRFLQRNRLIAALAGATVVVEAGWRSGSLNTAAHAAALGRPLGAVPGPVTSASSAGCHRVLREFDGRCVTNAAEIIELLGDLEPTLFDLPSPSGGGGRTDDRTRITDAMSFRTWRETTEIARRSGLAPTEVTAILGLLSLEGAVVNGNGGWRRTRPVAQTG
ncbi:MULTISPECIES: DNA-processing protein DprA [unclassified Microbacterium]|uniref:DNA-processing protein DprA n=1 Tax=unclassified Microbacterium TaxID=2609290 RepID=UPI00214CA56A|nr:MULTISPECIES: DNA-processing protein DprA [unclassified Microbacterium]MCR2809405.1 DNA-processing protein DprA [Microbacterium sp. zg.B185]WIM20542.1 DNA-processing protein DprA [Microbacterium sp. zg-B185]